MIGNVSREHENGDSADGEAKDDEELQKVSLVGIVRVLVVDMDVEIHEENKGAHHHGDDHQSEIEIAHFYEIGSISKRMKENVMPSTSRPNWEETTERKR